MVILYEINKNLTSKTNKPKKEILIERMHVYENPFRRAIKVLKEDYEHLKNSVKIDEVKKNERWIEDERATFKLPEPKKEEHNKNAASSAGLSSQILNDYY
jgi:hypothetical protein